MNCELGMMGKVLDTGRTGMLEGQGMELVSGRRELTQIAVALNTELAGNSPEFFFSTMFTVTFRAMLLMPGDKIRLLMSCVVVRIRITGKVVPCTVVAGEAFLIRGRSGLRVTTKRNNAVDRAGERDMALFASTLKHLMRR